MQFHIQWMALARWVMIPSGVVAIAALNLGILGVWRVAWQDNFDESQASDSETEHNTGDRSTQIANANRSNYDFFLDELFAPTYDYPSFNSPRLDQQLAHYADYIATLGVPDILVVGSSRALQGVDPWVLRETLAEQGYEDVRVYNFSVNGATAQVIDLLVRRILHPDQLPRLIIWADGSRAFNSGRPDATYTNIAASVGYQTLTTGDRPIEIQLQPQILFSEDKGALSPQAHCIDVWPINYYGYATNDPSSGSGFSVLSEDALSDIGQRFPCDPESERNAGEILSQVAAVGDQAPERSPIPQTWIPERTPGELDIDGFLTVDTQFNPATYYQQFPRVLGQYDSNYVPFQLPGAQTEATRNLATYAQQQNIPLVFVNLPLSRDYLDPFRQGHESDFSRYLADLASREAFTFVDYGQRWSDRPTYFEDPSHINRYGAAAVARQLATDPAIQRLIEQHIATNPSPTPPSSEPES